MMVSMSTRFFRVLVPAVMVLAGLTVPSGVAGARIDIGTTEPAHASADATERARAGAARATARRAPRFASRVPARTQQVVRTVSSRRWCARRWCTVTQAWTKTDDGTWEMLRAFRSTIGPNGFGKRREGDQRSPSGVYKIKVTFSTGTRAPGPMPWRRRLPTSIVPGYHNRFYNTWIEERGRTDGDRPSMRYGFIVDYNNVRLRVGAGPKPVIGKGSGIFYHTSRPGERWVPTLGCTQVGNPRQMRWIVRWLRPEADPRVVQAL
jgi:L,D-peptidoglycan transpeptidase YkuD (ErfK/YbiS/YcfS/YnhG family)